LPKLGSWLRGCDPITLTPGGDAEMQALQGGQQAVGVPEVRRGVAHQRLDPA
jgi:hypothetical protein